MGSIWTKDVQLQDFPTVRSDMKVDVLIIGGGMAGLLCGYFLKAMGAKYALLEQGKIAGGVTQNTTAKITAYHGLIYSKLIKEMGQDKAAAYFQANTAALEQYRRLSKEIDCDFQKEDNYIYSMEDKKVILEEVEAISRIGGCGIFTEMPDIPLPAAYAVKSPGQGSFHPLKFVQGIAEGQNIYEHSFAHEIHKERYGYQVNVQNQFGQDIKINAEKVIVAAHFPYVDRWGMYFLKMHQQRSYVLALENAKPVNGMYIGHKKETGNPLNLSFRTYGDYVLLGGGGGRTGTKYASYEELRQAAEKLYPGSRVAASWAAQDCMTLDGAPYIGTYAKGKDGLLVATGFNKWGMTGSMTAAMALTGKLEPETAEIFCPQRTIFRPQLAVNVVETTKNFLRPTAPRCTHLGCALKWNQAENSWDCSCHGSRFTEGGQVINNPAELDLKR